MDESLVKSLAYWALAGDLSTNAVDYLTLVKVNHFEIISQTCYELMCVKGLKLELTYWRNFCRCLRDSWLPKLTR